MVIIKHGGEAHVMRPDAVMRTSVIRPFVNYNPQADVQAVAQAFTTGGPLATTLGGLRGPGPIRRWWEGVKARAALRRGMAGYGGFAGPGPIMDTSSQVAPQMQAQMVMLRHLTQSQNPGQLRAEVASAASTLASRRPFTYYRAG